MPPKAKSGDSAAYQMLKQDIANATLRTLYIFHGEETYLRDYYLEQLKTGLLPEGMESFNFHSLEGKVCSAARLSELVDLLPMMSERTLILVTDYDLFKAPEDERRAMATLLSQLPDYTCLLFLYDLIAFKSDARMKGLSTVLREQACIVHFAPQSRSDLSGWIRRRLAALEREISPADTEYLIFLCGDLMQNLLCEIEKIGAFAKQRRITQADIDAVAMPQLDAVVFQMTDALMQKDFDKAAQVLSTLLQMQQAPIMILAVLGKQFRQLFSARLLFDAGKSADELMTLWGLRSAYPAERLYKAARGFGPDWCRRAVRRCAETDLAMKSQTGADAHDLLVFLLLELSLGVRTHVSH